MPEPGGGGAGHGLWRQPEGPRGFRRTDLAARPGGAATRGYAVPAQENLPHAPWPGPPRPVSDPRPPRGVRRRGPADVAARRPPPCRPRRRRADARAGGAVRPAPAIARLTDRLPARRLRVPAGVRPPHRPVARRHPRGDRLARRRSSSSARRSSCASSPRGAPPAGRDRRAGARRRRTRSTRARPTSARPAAGPRTPRPGIASSARSVDGPARLVIEGLGRRGRGATLARRRLDPHVARIPVGAPIFYRDVPLMPAAARRASSSRWPRTPSR